MIGGEKNLLLYDGECGMCNHFVQWMLRVDHGGRFRYAPLNGPTSLGILGGPVDPTTMIVVDDRGKHLREADAVFYLLTHLAFPWRLAVIGYLVPRFIRNAAYRWVAKRRHTLFPRPQACALPDAGERRRFLP